jgi:hypothetical protein
MPLPTTWHPLSDVGAVRGQGSCTDPCSHPQVGSLLRRRQLEHKQVRPPHVRQVRRGHVRDLSEDASAASLPRQAHDDCAGQFQVPLRGTAQALASEISHRAHLAVSAAIQSAADPHRASLEVGPPIATHNRFFATLGALLTAVSTCFDRWRKPNSVLRRLCGII